MNGLRLKAVLTAAIFSAINSSYAYDVDLDDVTTARAAFVEHMVTTYDYDRGSLEDLLGEAKIVDRILEAISRPAERVMAWHDYRDIFVISSRIDGGVTFWREHAEEVRAASEKYGVAEEILVAILGVETLYGTRAGSYRVLDSLSTLAFAYPPRSKFFTSELEAFLLLVREEGLDPLETLGSYAGAMGAGQFISSSFRAYAVDGNGDGQRDLWGDWEDVLASVANYFHVHDWRPGEQVAVRATLGSEWDGHEPENSIELTETVASLSQLGYIFGTDLPSTAKTTMLSLQGEDAQEFWVGFHNFYVITRYNRSVMYALATYELAQAIRSAYSDSATH
jgi:membrane-bound lytic murein transglycosylase B